jgi:Uma2 family endonuclease
MARVTIPVKSQISPEEYLAFEETSSERHEFVDGQVFAMAGGTTRHNKIAGALYARALAANNDPSCEVFIENVKLMLEDESHYYPDVMICCEEDTSELRYRRRPCFIAEVLSESTEAIDRGEKLLNYQKLESLQTYALISQDQARLEVFSRLPDGAWRYKLLEGDAVLKVPCAKLEVKVSELFQGIS